MSDNFFPESYFHNEVRGGLLRIRYLPKIGNYMPTFFFNTVRVDLTNTYDILETFYF